MRAQTARLATTAYRWVSGLYRRLRGSKEVHSDPWRVLKSPDAFDDILARYPAPEHPLARSNIKLGILADQWGLHALYQAACEELGVGCELIDLCAENWLDLVRGSPCDGFMVHPTVSTSAWKTYYDERLHVIAEDLGRPLRPLLHELWFYESKRRMAYWLAAHDVPHPETTIFYDREEAIRFCRNASYPLVLKSDLGSSASGVRIVRSADEAEFLVILAFGGGLARRGSERRDRDWGYVLFQEFLPDAREFRVIQIGDSWFAHEKLKPGDGDFHSGSGSVGWDIPPQDTWEFCYGVSRKGNFRAMDYDVFVTPDGRTWINELQAVFASYNPSQMYIDGVPGRYTRRDGAWVFEEGLFNRNGSANLRIQEFVSALTGDDNQG